MRRLFAVTFALVAAFGFACRVDAAASAPSRFHPIRDLASRVAPSLVPPKGCTSAVIQLARSEGVVPDLRGCTPEEIIPGLPQLLGLIPTSPPGSDQPSAPIVNQEPSPGQPVKTGGGITLTTQAHGAPRVDPKKTRPKGADPRLTRQGDTLNDEQPSSVTQVEGPDAMTTLFDFVWDGLNLLLLSITAIGGLLAWRLLFFRPKLEVRLSASTPTITFADPRRAVLTAPSIDITLSTTAPVACHPLPILSVSTRT